MKIYRNIEEVKFDCPTALTVGTFDGLHLGHQQVLKKLKEEAGPDDCTEMVITFHPHPRTVVGKNAGKKVQLLTALEEKLEILEELNIQAVLVIPFTKEFSRTSYQDFVRKILVDRFRVRNMVIGHDHAFGRNREGHPEQLKKIAAEIGFNVTVVPPYYLGETLVSSSRIRESFNKKDVAFANKLLGRNYTIHGKVESGDHRGTNLGYPTANIKVKEDNKLIPPEGVYAVDVILDGKQFKGMMNIGHRPTFNFDPLTLEVHIIKFSGSVYDKPLVIRFKKFVRDEIKFKDAEELKQQLEKDKIICERI